MTQHTKDFLAQELRKVGLDAMTDKAATGYYHDFLSPLALPETQLLIDLQEELKRRVRGQQIKNLEFKAMEYIRRLVEDRKKLVAEVKQLELALCEETSASMDACAKLAIARGEI